MNKFSLKHTGFLFSLLFINLYSQAQNTKATIDSTLEGTMRSNDKIYVVMAVCLFILTVFFIYLIRIDIKISKKEKQM